MAFDAFSSIDDFVSLSSGAKIFSAIKSPSSYFFSESFFFLFSSRGVKTFTYNVLA